MDKMAAMECLALQHGTEHKNDFMVGIRRIMPGS